MDVLISIRPEFVEKIKKGEKFFEYRKRIFKKEIKRVFVYSSSPQKRIIGYFEWSGVIKGNVDNVWKMTYKYAGVESTRYKKYFAGSEEAYAIKIRHFHLFNKEINPWEYPRFRAPQSFFYLKKEDDELYEELCSMVQEKNTEILQIQSEMSK